jgi:endonuclease/exonuclease/phosphatase family metal-dependent hydrolase
MKLVSLNIEGSKHLEAVAAFLQKQDADVICLQETQPDLQDFLASHGYTYATLPLTLRTDDRDLDEPEGLLLATKHPVTFDSFYYHKPAQHLRPFVKAQWRDTCAHGALFGDITFEGQIFCIGTTHFTWSPDGKESAEQESDMEAFLEKTNTMKPHIICGDFNIPRMHNSLYQTLCASYADNVPAHYTSSLDRTIHRLGNDPSRSIIFDEYMVDYVFTQSPYTARDVELVFGISDHAAVVATITQ